MSFAKMLLYYLSFYITSFLIIYSVTRKFNLITILLSIILFTLFIIIFTTSGNDILSISLPSSVNPVPTNLGLNGISRLNQIAGKYIN
jgi:hypothetical protein